MKNTCTMLDVDVLRDNLRTLDAALAGHSQCILVVKSNAYGHGMTPVAHCASEVGIKWFAVTHVDEAILLRDELPDADILILGALHDTDVSIAAEKRFTPILVDEDHARSLAAAAAAGRTKLPCHVKVDTGMGRLGIPWDSAPDVIAQLADEDGLDLVGLCSHFASAGATDTSFAETQAERFAGVAEGCEQKGVSFPFKHIANSSGLLHGGDWDFDGIRSGLLAYGYCPTESQDAPIRVETSPCLQWKTRIVQVRDLPADSPIGYDSTYRTKTGTQMAVLDVGYADGYCRSLSNKGIVLVGGQRVPVIGRVSMNFVAVDLGSASPAKPGDEAVLIGTQESASIWADELALRCDTIPYEILTSIRTDDQR